MVHFSFPHVVASVLFCAALALEVWLAIAHHGKHQDSRDHFTLPAVQVLVLLSALSAAFFSTQLPWLRFPLPRPLLSLLAIIFFASGIALRVWAVRTLGKYFTVRITIQEGQHVITSGPYQYVRHPSYTALLILVVGTAFLVDNLGSAVSIFIFMGIALALRIRYEEHELLATFGDAYREYATSHARIIPHIL